MEILSEEDTSSASSLAPEAPPASIVGADDEEERAMRLKESLQAQENLLGELTGALKRNQEKLQDREFEVKVISPYWPC